MVYKPILLAFDCGLHLTLLAAEAAAALLVSVCALLLMVEEFSDSQTLPVICLFTTSAVLRL